MGQVPFNWTGPQSPYKFLGNSRLPYAGVGVSERGWVGTFPGAGAGQQETLGGWGGFLVKRDIHPAAPAGLTGYAVAVTPIGGLTGGIQQQGQLTLQALSQYMAAAAATGGAPAVAPGSLAGG